MKQDEQMVRLGGLLAVLTLVACTSKPSDDALQSLFRQLPTPDAGWESTKASGHCTDDPSSDRPMPPYLVAEARGGDDSYLNAAEDALQASGFTVHRSLEPTSKGDIWAELGHGRSQIRVQVFSGPGQNPDGAPLPASTLLRMTRDPDWCT